MAKIYFPDSSFQQLPSQKEKLFGQELILLINKLSFLSVKIFCFLFFTAIRKKKEFVIDKLLESSTHTKLHENKLIKFTIKAEDRRFLFHYGHDILSILRAILNNIKGKRIQGASTIEQQLIRLILKDNKLTLKRKFIEILLSTYLHNKFTKNQIINLYLNNYIFSKDIIGIVALCEKEYYNFGNLSEKDICEIVARIKYPVLNSKNYIRYLRRVRTVEILNNKP